MSADRPDREGLRRPVTAVTGGVDSRPFVCLRETNCGVVEWGENVGGSSRWGRIATTRHGSDGWCRFLSVCLIARDFS